MIRVERQFPVALSAFVVAESVGGWALRDAAWTHAPLFYGEAFMGAILLAFALAIDPTGRGQR